MNSEIADMVVDEAQNRAKKKDILAYLTRIYCKFKFWCTNFSKQYIVIIIIIIKAIFFNPLNVSSKIL